VTFALAEKIGKSEAHHLIEAPARRRFAGKQHLRDVLTSDAKITAQLSRERIANCSSRWPIRAPRRPDRPPARFTGRT